MIIDTLVVVVCLMADTPFIQQIKQVPANRFTEQFREAGRAFYRAIRFERYRALGIISQEKYRILKRDEKDLDKMKELNK